MKPASLRQLCYISDLKAVGPKTKLLASKFPHPQTKHYWCKPSPNTEHLFFSAGKVCMTSPLSSYLRNLWDLGLFFVWRPCTQLLGLQCVWWGFPWPGLFSLIYSPGETWLCGKSTVGDQSILVNMYVPNLIHEPICLIHKVEQRYFMGSDQTKNFCHFKLENRITYIYKRVDELERKCSVLTRDYCLGLKLFKST